MEDEYYVDSSKDAKHQLHLHKRREAYRTKLKRVAIPLEAETQVEKQNRLESESNKRLIKRSTELPADETRRKSNSRTSSSTNRNAETPTSK